MECLESIDSTANAYKLLFKAIKEIPTSHYVFGLFLFLIVFLYNFLEFHFFEDFVSGFRESPVSLTYNPCSEIYEGVAKKCQILHGRNETHMGLDERLGQRIESDSAKNPAVWVWLVFEKRHQTTPFEKTAAPAARNEQQRSRIPSSCHYHHQSLTTEMLSPRQWSLSTAILTTLR
ncbi:unnamed protein product [Ilex paraguariensis]|uniref:Uncharacterized protein n=1 Tax=Ilex paraguariensis TaxID=185542 RepID=A0ABC8SF01_9AQUA